MSEKEKPDEAYEPWVEDPDEPEEDMTEEELKQLSDGVGRILAKKRKSRGS